nr:hypothetical protein [Chryseobacterium manosquense]
MIPQFSMGQFDALFRQAEEQHINQIVRVLRFVGEKAVNEARASGSYQDRTANLRNSVGYVIIVNGKIVDENFSISANGSEPSSENPIKYGRDLAHEIASQYNEIALIVVSGMKYGAYVEARGYNVLTSAEQLANVQVPMLLKQLR